MFSASFPKFYACLALLLSLLILFVEKNQAEEKNDPLKTSIFLKQKKPAVAKKRGVFKGGEVVVHGKKELANIEEASNTTVVTQKDIRTHANKTLEETLENIPGLTVETHTKGHQRLRLRGFEQSRVALFIDGLPVNDVFSTDVDISNFPVINMSRIIVNKGTSSALYGPNGLVGSINVISKKPPRVFAETNLEYGPHQNYTLNFAQGTPLGRFYYWLTGTIINSGGYQISKKLDRTTRQKWLDKFIKYQLYPNPSNNDNSYTSTEINIPAWEDYLNDDGLRNHTKYKKYNLGGKIGYELTTQIELGLNSQFYYKKGRTSTYQNNCYSDYKLDDRYWEDPLFEVLEADDIKKIAFRNRSFVWLGVYRYNFSPYFLMTFNRLNFRANIFYSTRQAKQDGYATEDHEYAKDGAAGYFYEPFTDKKRFSSYGLNLYPAFQLTFWNQLSLALLWRKTSYKSEEKAVSAIKSPNIVKYLGSDFYPMKDMEVSYLTLAIEDESLFFQEKLKITAGISYDSQNFSSYKNRHDVYFYEKAYIAKEDTLLWGTRDSFNPVVALTFSPKKNLHLKTAGSIKTRFPSLSEYSKIIGDDHDYKLKSERSYNFNTGLELSSPQKYLTFKVDFFRHLMKDRIAKIAGGSEPPMNIDKVISQGLESSISFKKNNILNKVDLNLQFFYTFIHARNKDDSWEEKVNKGEKIEKTPEHQFGFDWRLYLFTKTMITIWGSSTFNQIMYAMKTRPEANDESVGFSTSFFEEVKLHNPFFLHLKIEQKFLSKYHLFIKCKNILDEYKPDPFNPGPGRTFSLGFSAKI